MNRYFINGRIVDVEDGTVLNCPDCPEQTGAPCGDCKMQPNAHFSSFREQRMNCPAVRISDQDDIIEYNIPTKEQIELMFNDKCTAPEHCCKTCVAEKFCKDNQEDQDKVNKTIILEMLSKIQYLEKRLYETKPVIVPKKHSRFIYKCICGTDVINNYCQGCGVKLNWDEVN